jgi:hypothetical protein
LSRLGWVVVVGVSLLVTLILGFPYSCGESFCVPDGVDCPATCENVLGMSFEGGAFPFFPALLVIVIGVGLGGVVGLLITRSRSKSRRSSSNEEASAGGRR